MANRVVLNYNEVLRDFQYKPNFGFGAYESDGQWWIRIVMMVEDSREPFRQWEIKPMPQEDLYYGDYDMFRLPPTRSHSVGYSPSRELVEVQGRYVIPPFIAGEEMRFIEWMVFTIREMENHETDEWLRYKGELLNDPHKERA